jgi:ribose transport system ATP-binding protein
VAGLADRTLVLEDGKAVAELEQAATAAEMMRAAETLSMAGIQNELEKS